jgi:hydroxyacylglutathione hydrolase
VPLVVERVVLNREFGANCYVVRAWSDAATVAVVDPGGEPGPLLAALEGSVAGILVTHCDVDHVGGVADLAETTGAEVWAPAGEAEALRTGETRGSYPVRAHAPEHEVVDGDSISVGGIGFDVVGVPGHSIDHVAFFADGKLFSGDLLFAGSVGRCDLPGGDWAKLVDSIQRLVERFGPDTIVYPGHGEPTTLARELESNPFLGELRTAR